MIERKRTILFITPSFSSGGAEKNILNIINALDGNYFDIHLVVCDNNSAYSMLFNKSINLYVLNKFNVRRSLLSLLRILIRINPQIVFSSALHVAFPVLFFRLIFFLDFMKITRMPSLPSNNLGADNIKTKIVNRLAKFVIRKSDRVIAQTTEMKLDISSFYNMKDNNNIVVIPNLVDLETIKRKSKEDVDLPKGFYYYIAAGSLYSVKGFDLLIKAFSVHIQTYPQTKLIIIGEESVEKGYRKYLEELIIELGLKRKVLLLGHQSNPYKFFSFANVFVLSSIKEGFPNVVLENMVLKKPVLVTDCVDFSNIVKSSNGVIVHKNSIKELVKGLEASRDIEPEEFCIRNFDFNEWFKTVLNESITSNK